MTPYAIPPIPAPFTASVTLPGSKSIALRQLALAALCDGRTVVEGVPPCDDTDAMLDCLARLGVGVDSSADGIAVTGPMDFGIRSVELDARMSGASMRLLLALAALRTGPTRIDGHASLRARTNAPLLAVLAEHGCRVESDGGCLPTTVQGPFAPPAEFSIDGGLSSQYITALLVAAPRYAAGAQQTINITGELVSRPYVDITLNELGKRGVGSRWTAEHQVVVDKAPVQTGRCVVEGDATAATYFTALATLHGGEVALTNLGVDTVQGDYGFCDLMEELGASVARAHETVVKGPQALAPLSSHDLTKMPDAALTLIAMAPLLPEPTTIRGLSSLHHKECDRLECPAAELRALGVDVATTEDSIAIAPLAPSAMRAHTLNTYHDHRMAMAFSLLASKGAPLRVDDPRVVEKTYPRFWDDYRSLIA